MIQYTVTNTRHSWPWGAHPVVVIRTHDRAQALTWMSPGYRVIPKDRGRDYYGLRALERRAAAIVQYGLPGIEPDRYLP